MPTERTPTEMIEFFVRHRETPHEGCIWRKMLLREATMDLIQWWLESGYDVELRSCD